MAFSIKKLTLFKNLRYSPNGVSENNEKLTIYTNGVAKKNLEPTLDLYLTEPTECGTALPLDSAETKGETLLPSGTYLFVQGIEGRDDVRQAAEALWLESLWQEIELDMHTVYMRTLSEDGKSVFQLFRKIL